MLKTPQLPYLRGGGATHLLLVTLVLASSLFFIGGRVRVFGDSNTINVAKENCATTAAHNAGSKGQNSQVHNMLRTDLQCGTYLEEAGRKVICLRPQPGVPFVNGQSVTKIPLLVGVGPAKTGTSYLFSLLDNHPHIVVGNAARGLERGCCGSELYFFTSRFDYHDPMTKLSSYFIPGSKTDVKWLAEKTPQYHHDLLAPYKMKASIQPSSLALVLTLREPLEAHVSLFFHRMRELGRTASRTGYLEWVDKLLENYDNYQNCARRTLIANFPEIGDDNDTASDDLSWVGVQYMDEALHYECLQLSGNALLNLEGINSLLYAQTLLRWRRTFPSVRATCILHSDIVKDGGKELERVLSMLELNTTVHREEMIDTGISGESSAQSSKKSDKSAISETVGEARLLAMEQGDSPGATVEAMKQRLIRLGNIFRGHWDFAVEFCKSESFA